MMNKSVLVAGAVLVAAAAFAAQDAVFKRTVSKGEKSVHKLAVKIDFQGQAFEFRAKVSNEVTEVKENGQFLTKHAMTDQVIVMDGNEQPTDEEENQTVLMNPDGSIVKIEADSVDGDAYRFANLQGFDYAMKAVEVGTKWTKELKADKEQMTVDTLSTYEVVAKETVLGHECYKVKYSKTEKSGDAPASVTGNAWMDTKSGLPVKMVADFKNLPVQGMQFDGSWTMELAS